MPTYLKPDTQGATAQVDAVAGSSRARLSRAGVRARKDSKRAKGRDPLKSFGKGAGAGKKKVGGRVRNNPDNKANRRSGTK